MDTDIFGDAVLDFQNGIYTEDINTYSSLDEEDVIPLPYLVRTFKKMPELEKKALLACKGSVLDIGCGAGSHSLYLQKKGFHVDAIDISKGAIEVAKQRGVLNAEVKNILEETNSFDTVLLLMNGTGIFQELAQVSKYLTHLKSLLKPNGQILIDSSDIQYMYEDEDGGVWMDMNASYYGELDYFLSYKGEKEDPMKWLYLDFNTLQTACETVDLKCELVLEGDHFDYLARLIAV